MRKLLKRVVCFVMAVVLGVSSSIPAFADNPCSRYPKNSNEYQQCWIEFAGQNNILFYDPAGGEANCSFGGSNVFEKMLSALMSMGFTDVAAAGIYSNMMVEGLGNGALLQHEYGVNELSDVGTTYNGKTVTRQMVVDLYDIGNMHGIGPVGWSFYFRPPLFEVLEEYGVKKYATEWDESQGRYVYDGLTYDQMIEKFGQEEADKVFNAVMDFFRRLYVENEFEGRDGITKFTITQDDIDKQGLAKYGITSGMLLMDGLNRVATPYEAAELFFTSVEMRGWTSFNGHENHGENADKGLEMIRSAGLTAVGNYGAGPVALSGMTIEEKIWSGLTGFLSAEQAAGVMGNMYYESGLNPAMHEQSLKNNYQPGFDLGANEKVSYGIGLVQWSFGRRVNLYNYIKEQDSSLLQYFNEYEKYAPNYGVDGRKFLEIAGAEATDKLISLELEFLKDEIETYESYKPLLSQNTVYDAAKYFLERIEVPNNPTIEAHMNRVEKAEEYYEKYKNYSGSVCNYTDAGRLIEYVKLYAWPTYHSPQYLERTEAYAEAVKRRSDSGLWTGGSVRGVAGIDCGGFVTTVLNESGYDVGYNYGGDPGAGASAISGGQLVYIRSHGDEWQMVNESVSTPISDESALRPGDVAFSDCSGNAVESLKCEHTYLYIGEVEGFETHIASASYSSDGTGGRSPMSGMEDFKYGGSSVVVWFRKVK